MSHKLLVVGGNGFVGSAVCRAALGRGWEVTSISSSGMPFRTPKGHTPAWTSNVAWHTASALSPVSYQALLRGRTAVVHTVGTLLETGRYKEAVRGEHVGGLVKSVVGMFPGAGNPLKRPDARTGSYEVVNRNTALRVCETYLASLASSPPSSFSHDLKPFPFVYLSAEDMGRPLLPQGYITSKRQAEQGITALCRGTDVRGVFIRPSFIYHPHLRPITTPLAALASLSAAIHKKAPSVVPTPSRILRALASASASASALTSEPSPSAPAQLPSALHAMANTLELPPIHLDHVAEAVCRAIEQKDVTGPVGLKEMRELMGWVE